MDFLSPLIIIAHMSDPTASTRTDCSSDFAGAGVAIEWKSLEFEGALGARRTRCGVVRETAPGGYASFKWKPRKRK